MTKPRRSFTDEFKREAIALLQSSGRPLMQIAGELGIQPSMLRNWRNAVGVPAGASSELCWNLGDAVIRRRSVLACW
jgi:transposase-like protein